MSQKPIQSLLIANRSEIAERILNTAQKMGIITYVVYSEADAQFDYIKKADKAILLPGNTPTETYLRQDILLDILTSEQIDAVHPGYGFLAENPDFSKSCADQGICFIGPSPETVQLMGSKSEAKDHVIKHDIPLLPGYHGDQQEADFLAQKADEIGFPILIKAVAGGGGRGMRIVENQSEFSTALHLAQQEALSAFGNADVLLEKYVVKPRHIEIQILSDKHGNHLIFAERDCSIQRRYQKIIEEAPAPNISDILRKKLYDAAYKIASSIDYIGAGTIEFLVEGDECYFMEMNTRLQVEHRVTEQIFDIDLVEWQIRVAQGEKLPWKQEDLKPQGWSIQARVYAEQPRNQFMPSSGKLLDFQTPDYENFMLDCSFKQSDFFSTFYDAMIGKWIVSADSRQAALENLRHILIETKISGVQTNRDLLIEILSEPVFQKAETYTKILEQDLSYLTQAYDEEQERLLRHALVMNWAHGHLKANKLQKSALRLNMPQQLYLSLKKDDQEYHYFIEKTETDFLLNEDNTQYIYPLDDITYGELVKFAHHLSYYDPSGISVHYDRIREEDYAQEGESHETGYAAPLPGKITKVHVETGMEVTKGQALIDMEAMKMQHRITAHEDGKVEEIYCQEGDAVEEKKQLISIAA